MRTYDVSLICSRLLTLSLLGVPGICTAEWICTETSSQTQGDTILACGAGESQSLQGARDLSRQAAFREFDDLCRKSSSCAPFDVEVEPRRTQCEKVKGSYRCVRAIAFHITERQKQDRIVDVNAVQEEISAQKDELKNLESQYQKLLELESTEKRKKQRAAQVRALEKKLSQVESNKEALSRIVSPQARKKKEYKYVHLLFRNSIKVDATFNGMTLKEGKEGLAEHGVGYEYRPWYFLGLNFRYGIGTNLFQDAIRSQGDVPRTGDADSTAIFPGKLVYHDFSAGLTFYTNAWGLYGKGTLGTSLGKSEDYTITYGPLGTATSTDLQETSFSRQYMGVALGMDSRDDRKGGGAFFEVGVRHPLSSGSLGLTISVGGNFGF